MSNIDCCLLSIKVSLLVKVKCLVEFVCQIPYVVIFLTNIHVDLINDWSYKKSTKLKQDNITYTIFTYLLHVYDLVLNELCKLSYFSCKRAPRVHEINMASCSWFQDILIYQLSLHSFLILGHELYRFCFCFALINFLILLYWYYHFFII